MLSSQLIQSALFKPDDFFSFQFDSLLWCDPLSKFKFDFLQTDLVFAPAHVHK